MKSKRALVYVVCAPVLLILTVFWWISQEEHPPNEHKDSANNISNQTVTKHKELPFLVSAAQNNTEVSRDNSRLDLTIGGEVTEVDLVYMPTYGVDYDFPATGAQIYKDLSARALDGDALAARALGHQLSICEDAFIDEDLLRLEIDLINRSFASGDGSKYRFKSGDYQSVLGLIAQLEGDHNRCKSLSAEKLSKKTYFLEIASELGDYTATHLLRNEYNSNKDWVKLHAVAEDLWNVYGDPTTLYDLARLYSSDLVAPSNDVLNGEPVRVIVHAFNTVAAEYGYSSISSAFPNDATVISRSDTDVFLSRTAEVLSPAEHLAAEQLARELLQGNENCCRPLLSQRLLK